MASISLFVRDNKLKLDFMATDSNATNSIDDIGVNPNILMFNVINNYTL